MVTVTIVVTKYLLLQLIIIDCLNTTTSNCKKFATVFSEVILVGDVKFLSKVLTSQSTVDVVANLHFKILS